MVLGHFQGTGMAGAFEQRGLIPSFKQNSRTILYYVFGGSGGKKFKALLLSKNNLETTVSYIKMDFPCI